MGAYSGVLLYDRDYMQSNKGVKRNSKNPMGECLKILVVRRDNIGDLICTLPFIASLRALFPDARIDLLVNSYNAPVVEVNHDINNVYVYTKAKHKRIGESALRLYWRRLCLIFELRANRYDWLVLANVGYLPRPLRWAKQVGARRIVGFVDTSNQEFDRTLTDPVLLRRQEALHEVQYLMQLLKPFGSIDDIPSARIIPDPLAVKAAIRTFARLDHGLPLVGINISARLNSQQWPEDCFISLIKSLKCYAKCVLFWAPGSQDCKGHPGDDEKAAHILSACTQDNLTPYPTESLKDLIAAVSMVDLLVTADGGALHIGAACGKPIVAMFGHSEPSQWYPWKVPHIIFQPSSRDVRDISAEEIVGAVKNLLAGT